MKKWDEIERKELEGVKIEKLSVNWGDCYPVCYDEGLTCDDVLDSNGWLVWAGESAEGFEVDESYEYARPKDERE